MLIADGGGSYRPPVMPIVNQPKPQPASANNNNNPSAAAERARELQRQIEALQERIRLMQRLAAEARQRAIAAQQKAEAARVAADAARQKADKSKLPVDDTDAKKAEQAFTLAEARVKKEAAEAQLRDKDAALASAQEAQKTEAKKDADGKASDEANQKVAKAQEQVDAAKRTSSLSNDKLDYEEKESKALDAEAKVTRLTPTAGRPWSTVSDDEREALKTAQDDATRLRADADAAKTKFATAVGAEAPIELYGSPTAKQADDAAKQVPGGASLPKDPLHSPLLQFLQVSPLSSSPGSAFAAPDFTLKPTVTPEVTKTLSGIADGKTVADIAKQRGITADQLVEEAASAGVTIESGQPDAKTQQSGITVKRGDSTLVYTRDDKNGSLTVKATFADRNVPGPVSTKTVEATRDKDGRFVQSAKDGKTGDTTTHIIDPNAGTRTDVVEKKDGTRTETTTDLTGATVKRAVEPGEDYLDVAKAAGLSPEQLLALNPGVDYGKSLKDGQELVVSDVRTTTITTQKDGTKLEKTVESDGSLHVVATTHDGRRITLMGEGDPDESRGEDIRKGLFNDNKSVADMAKATGLTEQQVLDTLPPGSVTVEKSKSDGAIETRTIYDPKSNKVIVETRNHRHDRTSREVIDDKASFKVRQYDPESKQYVMKDVAGGVGYLQKVADDKRTAAGDLDQQISDLDKTIRLYNRMGESTSELRAQREDLVTQRDTAKGEAGISQASATSGLLKNQQVQLDKAAANAYQRLSVARPGSDEQKEAAKALDDILALTDKVDRLVKAGDKDVAYLIADLDRNQKHAAKEDGDEKVQEAFQKWKDEVWMWQGIDEKTAQKLKDQGLRPNTRIFADTAQENEYAWEAFERQQADWDKYGTDGIDGTDLEARNAWLQRNQASKAEVESNDAYYKVAVEKGNADAHVIKGDLDRLQAKKDAWFAAHSKDFKENFPEVKGEHGGQQEIDQLNGQITQLEVGVVQDTKARKYNDFLKGLSVTDRADPEKLKEANQKYSDQNAKDIDADDQKINDLLMADPTRRAQVSEDYIKQWAKDNPKLQAQLDGLSTKGVTNLRMVDSLIQERENLLKSSHEFQQLRAALTMQSHTKFELTGVGDDDVARVQKDLEGIDKTVEGQTWLRDMWSDTAEDSQAWTKTQRDEAKKLRDDLASGAISATEYVSRREALMDAYGADSIDVARDLQDSNETWSVVDEAVRMTVTAAAGIATTLATGGNIAAGIAVGVAVNQLWDTGNDIYAASNGRDIYADGHSSLATLGGRWAFDRENLTQDQVMFTLKDDAVDTAHAMVSATGVGAGMRTSAALTTRIALKKGVDLAAGQTLKVGSRVLVGSTSGTVGQAVDGAGRVGVEAMDVKLDGQWGTDEGSQRINGTVKSSLVGLAFAPATGAISGAIPMHATKIFRPALAAQFVNDAASSLGIGQVSAYWTEGHGMNRAQFIAASLQSVPGTLTSVALHPSRVAPRHKPPSGDGFAADGTPLQPTTLGPGQTWEGAANGIRALVDQHEQASQGVAGVQPLRPSVGETAVLTWLTSLPARFSGTRFVVSRSGPADTIFGNTGGMRVRVRDTYKTFEDASAAAEKQGGAWVHRVQPHKDGIRLGARRSVGADEIVGAVHVNRNGDVLPVGIPNTRHAADLVNASGRPGSFNPIKAMVRAASTPTKALAGVVAVQGGAIGAKIFGSGWVFDNVTGGAWAAWVNQTRGLGTRSAYFTGKRGLENALDMASRGETADAVRQVNIVANRRALRGLSPEEIASKKQAALDQMKQFGDAAHAYLEGAKAAGVASDVTQPYSIKLITEAEIKAGSTQKLAEMPDGTLVAGSSDAQALATALGDPGASPAKLAEAVDAYRLQQEGSTLSATQRRQATDVAKLQADAIDRLVGARAGEVGYGTARDMINTKGNLINMKDVQSALGSTMHMGSHVGVSFKYGALGFAANSGMSGTYNFVKHLVSPGSGGGLIKGLALSGEVVGNVPNIGIQWNYLMGLLRRTKFSDAGADSKVPIEDVKKFLDKRIARMEWLRDTWWSGGEKAMTAGFKHKAEESIKQDKLDLDAANAVGDPAPSQNLNLSKFILLRKAQADQRITDMKNAVAEAARTGDDVKLRAMAKTESELAAKSMNTAGDFMALPSMFRYTMMALGSGNPVLAGVTVFHGIVSNGGWLRAQQGKGTIYGFKMAPSGLYDGNGLFGVGKRFGRGYNSLLEKMPDSWGQAFANGAKNLPVVGRWVKTDNLFDSMKLGGTAEDAANRRRVRLLVSGAIAPTFGLLVKLLADDEKDTSLRLPGGNGSGPWNPGVMHPGEPMRDNGFARIRPAAMPELEPVDASDPDTDTLWGIAGDNTDTLVGGPGLIRVRVAAGSDGQGNPALAQLFNLNPRFAPGPEQDQVTNATADTDTVQDDWNVTVGERWVTA